MPGGEPDGRGDPADHEVGHERQGHLHDRVHDDGTARLQAAGPAAGQAQPQVPRGEAVRLGHQAGRRLGPPRSLVDGVGGHVAAPRLPRPGRDGVGPRLDASDRAHQVEQRHDQQHEEEGDLHGHRSSVRRPGAAGRPRGAVHWSSA
ncbi:hypothetical protein [Ornithinimicrobium kibberense]|uniref:hypothetical protein n=1 Tax=Ornithinimicrobium kibberense TaxID=282060 RepID=UPI003614EE34